MTDEELDKKVWEIIKEEIENIDLPDYVKFEESENGHITFKLDFKSNENGEMNVSYKPPVEMAKHLLTPSEKGIEIFKSEKLAEEFVLIIATSYLKSWLISFAVEIESAFSELCLAPKLFHNNLVNAKNKEDFARNTDIVSKYLKLKNQKAQKTIRQIIETKDKITLPKKRLRLLFAHFYELILPKWKEAKAFYEKNKQYDKWQEMMYLAIDEVFPPDLINKLADPDPYEAMPSTLALEQAARLCDFDSCSLSLRTKQKYLEESRQWIKEQGEDEKERLLADYFGTTDATLDLHIRLHEAMHQQTQGMQFIHYFQEWIWLKILKKDGHPADYLLWKENELPTDAPKK